MDAAQQAEVLRRAQQHEPAAFDALVETYGPRLYGYFYRMTGSRHDAEDLLQEVFVRVVRTIGEYRHDGRFEGWLFRIGSNLVRDRVRRSKRAKVAGLDGVPPTDFGALTGFPDVSASEPGARLQRTEQLDLLQRAIRQLPEPEREVILLRHFGQLSFREIADQMGTPLGTALARAHRGLAHLRQLLGEPAGVSRRARNSDL